MTEEEKTEPHPLGSDFDGDGMKMEFQDEPAKFEPEPTNEPDHVQVSGTDAQDADDPSIYLPSLVADEFAVQIDSARDMVLMGTIEIDGVELSTQKGWLRQSQISGKEITIRGSGMKSVRFRYAG